VAAQGEDAGVLQRSDAEFGELLRRFRLVAGFSQEALAERAGLSVDAIAALERGRRSRPRPFTVRLLADALALEAADRAALIDASASQPAAAGAEPAAATPAPLPIALTTFVGREQELAELRRQLSVSRLLTLTGAGGTGKTRLAAELAAVLVRQDEGPVWFVALDSVHEADLVAQAVAAAVGVREEAGRSALEAVAQRLRDSDGLVILDNCEHLVTAVGVVAQRLLLGCPRVRLLATSRAVLDLPGELTWRVPSLRLPPPDPPADLETLAGVESVRLFVERAGLADPAFRLTGDNAPAVVGICRRLDGIPLALELAAARVRVLSASQVLARLEDAAGLLTGGSRMMVARQRTLRATIEWSYELLRPAEQRVFDRLSVFSGGFELEAAESVAGDDVLDALTGLVDQSLVIAEPGPAGDMRFRLLEVLRQFGQARLEDRGESGDALFRHAGYHAELAEAAEPELMGADQARWMERVRQERDNVRAALAWSLRGGDDAAGAGPAGRMVLGLRLGAALWYFWYSDGALIEGRHWLERLCSTDDPPASTGERSGLKARALAGAAWLAHVQAQFSVAASLAEESLELTTREDDASARVNALTTLGAVALESGDHDGAADLFNQALELARSGDIRWWIGASLNNLGFLAYRTGDLERGGRLLDEGVARRRATGDPHGLASSLLNLGAVRFAQGDASEALVHYLESLRLLQRLGSAYLTAELLEDLSGVLVARGRPELATRVLSSAVAYRSEIEAPAHEWRQPALDRTMARLLESLGPDAYEAAWSAGSTLSIDRAVEEILSTTP
jgi:predicted ATPase